MINQQVFQQRGIKYWVTVASLNHVLIGVKGGFAQACHGKASPLRRTQPGDGLICYSPKKQYLGKGEKEPKENTCQKFTAIGEIVSSTPYASKVREGVDHYRVDVDFVKNCREVAWQEVKGQITFAGLLRFGFAEVKEEEFMLIRSKMLGGV